MKPIDILILGVVAAILAFVLWYIRKAKQKGVKCIGCPDSGKCSGNCACCAACHGTESQTQTK